MRISVAVGLDYVSHEDILPFSANNEEPFQHEMWNQFFSNSAGKEIDIREIKFLLPVRVTCTRNV